MQYLINVTFILAVKRVLFCFVLFLFVFYLYIMLCITIGKIRGCLLAPGLIQIKN